MAKPINNNTPKVDDTAPSFVFAMTDAQFDTLVGVLERIAVALEKLPPQKSMFEQVFGRTK